MSFAHRPNISLLRSLRHGLRRILYKHLVPTGLLVMVSCVMLLAFVRDPNVSASSMTALHPTPPLATAAVNPQDQNVDFSKFFHKSPGHARMPCLLCHRRETNAARPPLPGSNDHLPCAGCHAAQFASSTGPICTICHTDAQSGKLKSFPRLTSFNMRFDHGRHTRMRGVGCVTCHQPSRAGVAMTIPSGLNAHVTCYRCHSPGAKSGDRDISSCGVCHQTGRHVRTRQTAAAFRLGFSHAKHDKSEGLTCNECHRVRAGVARQIQVSAPQPLHHHASPGAFSCMTCHNGKRAFGGDDFSVCKRCHTGTRWHF